VAVGQRLARDVGLVPRTTPIDSPQSNGMTEAFVKTLKRDYARVNPCPNAATVLRQLNGWFEHYNTVHPRKALGYRSPREFRSQLVAETTENAVGALRRPHEGPTSADAVGSSPPAARSAETRSVWLGAAAAVDQPKNHALSGYSGATTALPSPLVMVCSLSTGG
jgi:Integrase core domain